MKKLTFFILTGIFISNSSFADIGRIETKRERLQRQSKESGGKLTTDAYLKIHENFLKENYAEVDRLSSNYLSGGFGKPNSEDVLYLQALSLLKLSRGNEARIKFRELESSFTATERKASASASIADSYYYEGNFEEAAQAYQETLRKYPNSDQTTYASYKIHELSIKLGKSMDLVNHHPTLSQNVIPVTQLLRQNSFEETPFFTVQIGSFSKLRNANTLIHKLNHHRYDAYIEKDPSSGMYRVRVGKFTSKTDAFTVESRLKQEGYSTKIYP